MFICAIVGSRPRFSNSSAAHARAKKPRSSTIGSSSITYAPARGVSVNFTPTTLRVELAGRSLFGQSRPHFFAPGLLRPREPQDHSDIASIGSPRSELLAKDLLASRRCMSTLIACSKSQQSSPRRNWMNPTIRGRSIGVNSQCLTVFRWRPS